MGTVHNTDEALLLSGELEDFGRFYDRYVSSLLAFFQRRVLDPEAAADLTAETFAAAMVARPRFRAEATAVGWLFGIARHKLADYQRHGIAEDAEMSRWLGEEVATQMVEELAPEQREAVRAHVLEDRGYAEIAARERLSEATVRKRVSRGLQVLRDRAGGIR